MKLLLRICLVLFVLLVAALVGGYFLLTNSGFQKRMIESRLPAGSSVKTVKVTAGHASMEGLVLVLPDGTRLKLAALDTSFSPWAAIFHKTIRMGNIGTAFKLDFRALLKAIN